MRARSLLASGFHSGVIPRIWRSAIRRLWLACARLAQRRRDLGLAAAQRALQRRVSVLMSIDAPTRGEGRGATTIVASSVLVEPVEGGGGRARGEGRAKWGGAGGVEGSMVHGSTHHAARGFDVGAGGDEQLGDLDMPFSLRILQRREAALTLIDAPTRRGGGGGRRRRILGVWGVGGGGRKSAAGGESEAGRWWWSGRGAWRMGTTHVVLGIEVGAGGDEQLDGLEVALARCQHQRRVPACWEWDLNPGYLRRKKGRDTTTARGARRRGEEGGAGQPPPWRARESDGLGAAAAGARDGPTTQNTGPRPRRTVCAAARDDAASARGGARCGATRGGGVAMAAGGWKGCAVRRAARTTHAAHAMVVAGVVGHGGAQWHHALRPGCPATDPPSSRRRRETAATRPAAAAAAHRRRTRGGGTTTARGRTRERRSSRVVASGTRRERERGSRRKLSVGARQRARRAG